MIFRFESRLHTEKKRHVYKIYVEQINSSIYYKVESWLITNLLKYVYKVKYWT